MIVLILPFAADDLASFKKGSATLFRDRICLMSGVCLFFAVVSIQLIVYKISTGSFFIYSYGEEGFDLFSTHFVDILFSYKKGLFVYTPLLFLSLFGGYSLWRSSRYKFFSWFGFFFIMTYVLSSWWMWYYGGSFSSRVYVEYIPLFMILLAISVDSIRSKILGRSYVLLIALLIIICQIQTYQYRYYHIHWSDMTKAKYWSVFLRIDELIE